MAVLLQTSASSGCSWGAGPVHSQDGTSRFPVSTGPLCVVLKWLKLATNISIKCDPNGARNLCSPHHGNFVIMYIVWGLEGSHPQGALPPGRCCWGSCLCMVSCVASLLSTQEQCLGTLAAPRDRAMAPLNWALYSSCLGGFLCPRQQC